MNKPLFYAKILLFGEYGIIEDSQGLTVPYNFYKGCLQFSGLESDFEKKSNLSLKNYYHYLESLTLEEAFQMDLDSMNADIQKGLFFNSNIPQGYGVGSSGAMVAALFDRYSLRKKKPTSISKQELIPLQRAFGLMESYFHGKSSGMDPLICYMNFPILIENKQSLDRVELPKEVAGKGAIFLIDSGEMGETEPMVQLFFEKLKNEGFRNTLRNEFIKYNNACIHNFLIKDMNPFFVNVKNLSQWAYEHFRPMIPTSIIKIWKKGLQSNAYYLKLCGSGGGGYILGFTQDYERAEKMLKDFQKEIIYRF